jgi:hypothetical protein
MDVLYYSNHCSHCAKVLTYVTKNNLGAQLNFVCVDKRARDANNNQMYVVTESGRRAVLPPNVHSVPSLLRVKQNYSVVSGQEVIDYLASALAPAHRPPVFGAAEANGEPVGAVLSGFSQNVRSETYTSYADDSANAGTAIHYVDAGHETRAIPTPDDTYKPDKLSSAVTVDAIQQRRNAEVPVAVVNAYSPDL